MASDPADFSTRLTVNEPKSRTPSGAEPEEPRRPWRRLVAWLRTQTLARATVVPHAVGLIYILVALLFNVSVDGFVATAGYLSGPIAWIELSNFWLIAFMGGMPLLGMPTLRILMGSLTWRPPGSCSTRTRSQSGRPDFYEPSWPELFSGRRSVCAASASMMHFAGGGTLHGSAPSTAIARHNLTVPQHIGSKSLEALPGDFADKILQFVHLPWIRTALLPDPRDRLPGPASPAVTKWKVPDGAMTLFSSDCFADES